MQVLDDNVSEKKGSVDQTPKEAELQKKRTGISVRSVLISLVFLAGIAYMNPQAVYYQTVPRLNLRSVPNPTALFVVLLLMLVNVILKFFKLERRMFSRGELLTVYGLVYMGGLVANYMIGIAILPGVMGYYEYIYSSPRINPFLDKYSDLLFVRGEDEIISFYMGQSEVPWSLWVRPAIIWSLFILVIIFVSICLIYLVRKRWNEIEKLQYPLVLPVLELTKEGQDGSTFGAAWRDPMVWLGMAIPFVYYGLNGLSRYVPVPEIKPIQVDLAAATGINSLGFYPAMIFSLSSPLLLGIGYMVPLNLLFSVWFFFILWRVFIVGYSSHYNDPAMLNVVLANTYPLHTGFSSIAMALSMLHPLRHEIKAVILNLFGRKTPGLPDNPEEVKEYKVALLGFVFGMIAIVIFSCKFLFAKAWWAICYFIMAMSAILALARFRAEMGMPIERHFSNLIDRAIFYHLPTSVVGAGSYLFSVLTYADFQLGDIGSPACIALEQYKMADEAGVSRKSITRGFLIVIACVMAMTWYFNVTALYENGAMMTGGVYSNRVTFVDSQFRKYETFNENPNVFRGVLIVAIFGFAFTYILSLLNARIVHWPFHPAGYVLSTYLPVAWGIWSHFLMAWVIKSLVMRYGGVKGFRKLKPFFLGLIAGSVIMDSFWGFVAIIVGH